MLAVHHHLVSDHCCLEQSRRYVRRRPLQTTTQHRPPLTRMYMTRWPTPGRL